MKHGKSRSLTSGFSLVEVTIAMAIAAVAIVTLIGLLPQGMNTMRDAGDEAIEARIHQRLLNEMQMANFDSLDDYNGLEFYYDSQGEELGDSKSDSSVKGSFEHIYTAKATVPDAGGGGRAPDSVGGASFEGIKFSESSNPNETLRLVIIEVAAVGGLGETFDWKNPDNRKMISTYQTTVVKMGRDFE